MFFIIEEYTTNDNINDIDNDSDIEEVQSFKSLIVYVDCGYRFRCFEKSITIMEVGRRGKNILEWRV